MAKQEYLKLLNDFEKTPSITLREWQRVLNHILNNLTNGIYVTTTARNVTIDDAGNYYLTDNVEYALQFLALSLLDGIIRVTTKTANATLTSSEFGSIICNKATSMTINLPTANGIAGKGFFITNKNIGTVTIDAFGTETIQGDLTFDLYQDENINIVSDGVGWYLR